MANVLLFTMLTIILFRILSISDLVTCTYFVYFKSAKELNYNRFVDLNIFGAARHVHSDLRIYRVSFFLHNIHVCVIGT